MSDVGRKGGSVGIAFLMLWVGFLGICVTIAPNAHAGTVVSGHITSTQGWTDAGNPYWVVGDLTIDFGAQLILERGAELYASPGVDIIVDGQLVAAGSSTARVLITSNSSTPSIGDWGVVLTRGQGQISFVYAEITYGSGISITGSRQSLIAYTRIAQNRWGILLESSYNGIFNNTIEFNQNTGVIYNGSQTNNHIQNSTIQGNGNWGMSLEYGNSTGSYVRNNIIHNNKGGGIRAQYAEGLEIFCNYVGGNSNYGFRLYRSGFLIHHNNVKNNTDNAWDNKYYAIWDDNNKEGNYWSDYNGSDTDGDGVGEQAYYILPENRDRFPLVNPVIGCPIGPGGPVGDPPIAVAKPLTQTVDLGEYAWFNGSDSYDPDGWIVSYQWIFGDGGSDYGVNVTHAYSTPGTYDVQLRVVDDDGLTDTDYDKVFVLGNNPVADAGPDQSVGISDVVELNGSNSYDPDGFITDWLWDFGDGSPKEHGEVAYHAYDTMGSYIATLKVTDDDNLTDTDTATINVQGEYPVSDPNGPYTGRKNFPVYMTGNDSYDPDGTIVELEWNFGDGSSLEYGWWVSHTYSSGGSFNVTLRVTDDDNLTDFTSTVAEISDEWPGVPGMQDAVLSGGSLDDITLTWSPSPDDGAIENDVVEYHVYYGTSYDPDGVGYSLMTVLPAGSISYTISGAGQSDHNTYFYFVKAVDDAGHESCGQQAVKFARHMPEGMQLISIPVLMSDTSIRSVFQTLSFKKIIYYDAMAGKRHNWRTFDTRKPYNSLSDVSEKMALWVDVSQESYLTVAGLVPMSTTISLVVGWNFVGYASFFDSTVAETFSGAIYQKVEGFDLTDPPWYLKTLSDSDTVHFGNGYWIHVSEAFDWTVSN